MSRKCGGAEELSRKQGPLRAGRCRSLLLQEARRANRVPALRSVRHRRAVPRCNLDPCTGEPACLSDAAAEAGFGAKRITDPRREGGSGRRASAEGRDPDAGWIREPLAKRIRTFDLLIRRQDATMS